jgi:hypothetical protein
MAQTTRQEQYTGGADKSLQKNVSKSTGTVQRTASPRTNVQTTTSTPGTVTQKTKAVERVSSETLPGQNNVATEDLAFTLSFSLIINSPLPCEEQT